MLKIKLFLLSYIVSISILFIFSFSISTDVSKAYWPCPNYKYISSFFGYRNSPTLGASTYHNGMDIAAPENSKLLALFDGKVKYIGFLGSAGHSLIIEYTNGYTSSYCHISPKYIVSPNDNICAGQVVAFVGPKFLDLNSQYFFLNSNGIKTNGATTGPHLHFKLQLKSETIDPLSLKYIY